MDFDLDSVMFDFISSESADDMYYVFENGKIDYGLRRSLDNLIDNSLQSVENKSDVITFYSYKGGVGRTTSLALLARYYSEQGKVYLQ